MIIEKREGNKAVTLREDKYGIELMTMLNGFQWTGMPMDEELLDMLETAIIEFKESKDEISKEKGQE